MLFFGFLTRNFGARDQWMNGAREASRSAAEIPQCCEAIKREDEGSKGHRA